MSDILSDIESVRILRIEPGDVLVATLPKDFPKPTQDQYSTLREALREAFPDNEVLVLGGGLDITVARAEQ